MLKNHTTAIYSWFYSWSKHWYKPKAYCDFIVHKIFSAAANGLKYKCIIWLISLSIFPLALLLFYCVSVFHITIHFPCLLPLFLKDGEDTVLLL